MAFNCINPCVVCPPPPPGTRGLSPNDPNNPFLNLSSESPDFDGYIGRRSDGGPPFLGSYFTRVGCLSFCVSEVSQEEADLCAARQEVICNSTTNPGTDPNPNFDPNDPDSPPVTHPPRPVFANTRQSCSYMCPDGSENTEVVDAGTIFAFSQVTADTQAHQLACNRASLHSICMSALSADRICFDQSTALSFSASNNVGETAFAVIGGELPPGMSLVQDGSSTAQIVGTPTIGGVFNFTIGCSDFIGNSGDHTYALEVFGITNYTVLPGGSLSTAYSQSLTVAGTTVGTSSFAVVLGELPPGLTLNLGAGVISGSPTELGNFEFTIEIRDEAIVCERDFSINIDNPAGVFLNIIWGAPGIALVHDATGSASASGNVFDVSAAVGAYTSGLANTSTCSISGGLTITTASVINGFIEEFPISIPDPPLSSFYQTVVFVNGGIVYFRQTSGVGSVGDGHFSIPIGINQTMSISIACLGAAGSPSGPASSTSTSGYIIQI